MFQFALELGFEIDEENLHEDDDDDDHEFEVVGVARVAIMPVGAFSYVVVAVAAMGVTVVLGWLYWLH